MTDMNVSSGAINSIYSVPVSGMDLETALMAVQSKRAELLETQLKGQLEEVQARNKQVGLLNEALSNARTLSSKFKSDDKSTKSIKDISYKDLENKEKDLSYVLAMHKNSNFFFKGKGEQEKILQSIEPLKQELISFFKGEISQEALSPEASGLLKDVAKIKEEWIKANDKNQPYANLEKSWNSAGLSDFKKITNKGELDSQIENLKSMIDSLSNSQQMDMLRLQSLSNKRNEAFDLMTNFIKKMQDSRSSIISSMR